jgi:hypothetical protein
MPETEGENMNYRRYFMGRNECTFPRTSDASLRLKVKSIRLVSGLLYIVEMKLIPLSPNRC